MAQIEHSGYPEIETQAAVSASDVRQALQRILSSALFRSSRRPSQFLRFIVESTLAGEAGRIKEYVIGVEVFGRPTDYDPKDDPIVRIEAGRLRKKLAEYYGGPGGNDSVIIEVPKGSYVPAIQFRASKTELKTELQNATPGSGKQARGPRMATAAVIVIAAAALASTFLVRLRHQSTVAPTSIAVLPFLNLSGGPAGEYLGEGIAEELTTGLAEIKGLRVAAATSAFSSAARRKT
jgi:hypothetical protein